MTGTNPYCSQRYPELAKSWSFSQNALEKIKNSMASIGHRTKTCIAVAGSFGRFEASQLSDLDYIIISDNEDEYESVKKSLDDIIKKNKLYLPNSTGVFSSQVLPSKLIDIAGAKNENLDHLAQRILLLLEAKPIYNEQQCEKIQLEILDKYLEYLRNDPNKFPLYLLNDTIRYFRWICVNYQFSFWKENEKWTLRNIKLRHSRIVMYAGMLLVLLNSCKKSNKKRDYIAESLRMTPLERIVSVFQDNGCSCDSVLELYEYFLSMLNQKIVRDALQVSYEDRNKNSYYETLKLNSDKLQKELSNFVYNQRGNWSDEAFEYLVF
jgi:hypothetical protein